MSTSNTQIVYSYTGNGSSTVFTFGSPFLNNSDLDVYVDGVLQSSGYTVSGGGTQAGGSVTFTTAPANASAILIINNPALTQLVDLTYNGALPSTTLESSYDKLVMIAQYQNEEIKRSLRFPIHDTTATTLNEIDLTSRKNKLLGFDSTGKVSLSSTASATYQSGNRMIFSSVSAMTTETSITSVTTGDVVLLTGYYAAGDFGPAIELVVEASTGGVKSHTLNDGRYANFYADRVLVEHFGAKGDGTTDDTTAIQAALDSGAKVVETQDSTYLVGSLTISSSLEFYNHGTLKQKAASSLSIVVVSSTSNVLILGGIWDGNLSAGQSGTDFTQAAVTVNDSTDVRIEGVTSKNSYGSGFLVYRSDNVTVQNCKTEATTAAYGIYCEPTITGTNNTNFGLDISHNEFRTAALDRSMIYIASDSDNTSGDNNWYERCTVAFNKCYAPSGSEANANAANIGITYRAKRGILQGNYVENAAMCISCDWSSDTVIADNVAVNCWKYFYEMVEIDNGRVTGVAVTGNTGTKTGTATEAGIILSSTYSGSTDVYGLTISGNNVSNVTNGIFIQGSALSTGFPNDIAITGNTINDAESYGVRLRDIKGATITGNHIRLDDPTKAAGRGVFLENECQRITITGNTITDGLVALLMSGSGATYKDIVMAHNILNTGSAVSLSTGTASTGIIIGPNAGDIGLQGKTILDYANDIYSFASTLYANPEGVLTAGVGSEYTYTTSGTVFRKMTGTGNTGWQLAKGMVQTLAANDATPSVRGRSLVTTANSSPTTITALDDGLTNQTVTVIIGDGNTTVDFTGTNLKGNAGVDWTPASGDFMRCTYNGTNWYCNVVDATV